MEVGRRVGSGSCHGMVGLAWRCVQRSGHRKLAHYIRDLYNPRFNSCFTSHSSFSVPTPMSTPSPKRRDPSPGPEPAKKRRRGATRLSCAECRRSLDYATIFCLFISNPFTVRLKLRCDRGIPCGSCLKRGCGAICPDGRYSLNQSTTLAYHLFRFAYHRTGQSVRSRQHLSLRLVQPLTPLPIDSYLRPPKSCMRRSRSCVLVSETSKMRSELRIA